jgi:subtilisin family serine protease
MNKRTYPSWINLILLLSMLLSMIVPAQALAAPPAPAAQPSILLPARDDPFAKIERLIFDQLSKSGKADFFVWLEGKADLSAAYRLKTKQEKGAYVYSTLRAFADSSQKDLRQFLDSQKADYESFYIANKILVRQGDEKLLLDLARRADVARLTANHEFQLQEPIKAQPEKQLDPGSNITFIGADQVWNLGITGQGIVLAGNDTGLDVSHPAIRTQYRGCLNPPSCTEMDHNYNWWDAISSTTAASDYHGHGTHSTGTMVGDDGEGMQIGVAPGAKTVHCKNMTDGGWGDDTTFTTCFQWDLAPWDLNGLNPRPDLAPDAINNSWGYWGGGHTQFEDEIEALQAAGILVEVSAGNEGDDWGCASLRSPADYAPVLTTGSVDHTWSSFPGRISYFSSRGPSSLYPAEYFPDVMAPGSYILSAVPWGYEYWSGTSMAGPHVTALTALLWSANPGLRGMVAETAEIIKQTAVPLVDDTGYSCGGDYVTGPNHDWGYGTIDALAAAMMAMSFGEVGYLEGHVYNAETQAAISKALVRAVDPGGLAWQRKTDIQGFYSMAVFSNTYTVEASYFGLLPNSQVSEVISGTTSVVDFYLSPAPTYTVSGTVTDQLTGWPLYASISFPGIPVEPVWSDPVTGFYSVELPEGGPYHFYTTAWVEGYSPSSFGVGPVVGDLEQDITLTVNPITCSAPGYEMGYLYQEDFEASSGGYTVYNPSPESWEWGTPSSWPYGCGSGEKCWGTNLEGNYSNYASNELLSPVLDFSELGLSDTTLNLKWDQAFYKESCCDHIYAEVNINDTYWTTFWTNYYDTYSEWNEYSTGIYAEDLQTLQFRFLLTSDVSVTEPGYYIDNVRIEGGCQPREGGLVVGNVYADASSLPLIDALVSGPAGEAAAAQSTPLDPNVDDAFYTIFAPPGPRSSQPRNTSIRQISLKWRSSLAARSPTTLSWEPGISPSSPPAWKPAWAWEPPKPSL